MVECDQVRVSKLEKVICSGGWWVDDSCVDDLNDVRGDPCITTMLTFFQDY